ncbi:hypothetical protein HU200_052997 [Digitaria exilis]|uniref:Uncharacterized protein n=1 Tax=Digitaria exilis TaxID=1010633 RepID=A0A835AI42_9POAL|nr:hypothetical protein HU200_052997 [Digitaria exilis]CAB3484417.1 unnamed protein product [Digitaria exilis]
MEVFIHEDYVNKRNELKREQRRRLRLQMLQVEQGNLDASRQAMASRESPRVPAQCLTPSGVRSPTAGELSSPATAAGEAAGSWSSEHRRLFDCLKPY